MVRNFMLCSVLLMGGLLSAGEWSSGSWLSPPQAQAAPSQPDNCENPRTCRDNSIWATLWERIREHMPAAAAEGK